MQGYEDKLERVMDRVSAIESLGRTREVRGSCYFDAA